jgi:hypothetical protein
VDHRWRQEALAHLKHVEHACSLGQRVRCMEPAITGLTGIIQEMRDVQHSFASTLVNATRQSETAVDGEGEAQGIDMED